MERNSFRIVSVCVLTMASGCRAYKGIAYALWRTLEAAPTSDITKCGNTVESESAVESVRAGVAGGRVQAQVQGSQMVLLFLSSVFAANRDRGNDREGEESVSGTCSRVSTRLSCRFGQCKQPTHVRGTLCSSTVAGRARRAEQGIPRVVCVYMSSRRARRLSHCPVCVRMRVLSRASSGTTVTVKST